MGIFDLNHAAVEDHINYLQDFNSPPIVCLCGSTRFKSEFEEANRLFTLKGYVVLSVGFFMHAESEPISLEQKLLLDALHKMKIHMADKVYVICPEGYIGESTKSEIMFASKLGIPIYYSNETPIGV